MKHIDNHIEKAIIASKRSSKLNGVEHKTPKHSKMQQYKREKYSLQYAY